MNIINTLKQTTYHKEEIRPVLIKHLTDAVEKIHLAIGWINDIGLEGLLQKKAIEGVEVILILIKDQDNQSKSNAFQELISKGVQIIFLDTEQREHLIDHKFGVIDAATVLTGNYGWGYKNAPQEEFLSITENVFTLANGFEMEFEYLTISEQLSKNEPKPSNSIIDLLKKMEVVKTLLGIGDTEFLHLRFKEFESFIEDKNIAFIHEQLLKENYEEALNLIKIFTQYHQPLRECICLLYTSPSPRDATLSRMPSSA